METIVGIDLGTTNCSVTAINKEGKTKTIKNKHNEFITPSAVYFCKKEKEIIVGKDAKEKSNTDPDNLVLFVKREMGKSKDKVRENRVDGSYNPYKFWGTTYSPEQISAMILSQLKRDAEKELGKEVKKTVITCPAYFGDAEKNATKMAGEIAGFEVLEIIPEPTAAALTYSARTEKDETVLVFDLGGGTFDVTILKISNTDAGRNVEMIVTDGDHRLGGKDWDDLLIDYMVDRFEKKYQIDLYYEDKKKVAPTFGKLRIEVEKAKVALFKEGIDAVSLSIEYGGKKHTENITRALYAAKTQDLTNQCRTYCNNILQESDLSWNDIDTVLMIGNMSNCKTIQDALKEWSGKEINFGLINPKTCVSEGAAIKGHLLEGGDKIKAIKKQDSEIAAFEQSDEITKRVEKSESEGERTDTKFDKKNIKSGVLSSSVGIKVLTRDGKETVYKLLNKNSSYPEEISKAFPVFRDGDQEFSLNVLEGESSIVGECDLLGSIVVKLDAKMNKGDKLSITLSVDANGILQVKAINDKLGIYVESKIKRESDISDEEVKAASEDMEEFYLG
ncbi:MAG: Hsp70 family protein [Spirochaetia bacterium]|nr:Hsp70 family protein [Spirochaetia bacterium]